MSAPDAGQRRQELAASPVIKKLRWQFVAACMGLIAIVLAIVFGCVWASAQSALERSSHMALEQALSRRGGTSSPASIRAAGMIRSSCPTSPSRSGAPPSMSPAAPTPAWRIPTPSPPS